MTLLNEKEKCDALLELHKIRVDKYKQTRELEFKVNIALWTLIVLFGQFSKDKILIETSQEFIFFICVALVVVLGHYLFWLVPISESLARDNEKAHELQHEIELLTGLNSLIPVRTMKIIKQDYIKWNFFLAGITLILIAMLGIFLII